jgi:hypothetical protein
MAWLQQQKKNQKEEREEHLIHGDSSSIGSLDLASLLLLLLHFVFLLVLLLLLCSFSTPDFSKLQTLIPTAMQKLQGTDSTPVYSILQTLIFRITFHPFNSTLIQSTLSSSHVGCVATVITTKRTMMKDGW